MSKRRRANPHREESIHTIEGHGLTPEEHVRALLRLRQGSLFHLTPSLAESILAVLEKAGKLLAQGPDEAIMKNPRAVLKRRAEMYAEQMKDDQWIWNGDSLRFFDIYCIDGQHRCWAVIFSGKSQVYMLAKNLSKEAAGVIDKQKPRQFKDALWRMGKTNIGTLQAATKILYRYEQGAVLSKRTPVDAVLIPVFEKYEKRMREGMHWVGKLSPLLPASFALAGYVVFAEIDEEEANRFYQRIVDRGRDVGARSAVRQLEKYLHHQWQLRMQHKPKHDSEYLWAHTIVAWNDMRLRRSRIPRWRDGKTAKEQQAPFPRAI
jgi:hypothetical protein